MSRLLATAAIAAVLTPALFAVPAARAEYYSGPLHNDKQQCFKESPGWHATGFGYWTDCPGAASATDRAQAQPTNRTLAPAHVSHHRHRTPPQ